MARNPRKTYPSSKKHLARLQKERIMRRYILIATIAVVVLVAALVGYGVLSQTVLFSRQPVAIVNNERISTGLFQDLVRYDRYQLIRNAENIYSMAQYFGNDPQMLDSIMNQLMDVQAQLAPEANGEAVLENLIEDKLIRQEAKKRGITVTPEEVNQAFQEAFGYFPGGTPTPTNTLAPLATSTLSSLQMTLVPPTPTPTATPVITITETPTFTATPTLEWTATPTLAPTPTSIPTASPTPTPYTLEGYQKLYKDTLNSLQETYGVTETALRYVIESGLYRQKLAQEITANVPRTQEQVWAKHILVSDEQQANEILIRVNAGEDWSALAAEYSQDTSNKDKGGDLGWFGKGKMVAEFEAAAFSLKVGEVGSQPVKTNFGYHIIQVIGHEDRPLTNTEYEQAKQEEFTKWLEEAKASAVIEKKDYWVVRTPTEPALPAEIANLLNNAALNIPTPVAPIITVSAPTP